MQTEESLCPKCKIEFTDLNPPRLLTMCGHTFCEKCVRQLMVKKKMSNKYKLTCPLDKMAIQMGAPNPGAFPKNLSVLNLAKRKIQTERSKDKEKKEVEKEKENDLANNRISDIIRCKSSQSFRSNGTVETQMFNTMRLKTKENESEEKKKRPSFFTEQICPNTCLLHQKPLELVCARDFQKICASCVIFGEHRGHTVKNVHEAEQTTKNLHEKLKRIHKDYKKCFEKLQSKELTSKLDALLHAKKSSLTKSIGQKFKSLIEQVHFIEKKTLSKLDKKLDEYRTKLYTGMNQKKCIKEKYQDWQKNLLQKIDILEDDNEEQRLKTGLKSDTFVEASQKNLQLFFSIQPEILKQSQQVLDNLALHSDQQQMKRYLKQYCKFQDCSNSFLDMNASRITTIMHEEILLDDIQIGEPIVNRSFLRDSQVVDTERPIDEEQYQVRVKMVASSVFESANNRLNRVKSTNADRFFCSPQRKNSGLKSNKVLMFGTQRSSLQTLLKSKSIPSKYEQKLQPILAGSSDTLDLTNGQLSNQKVLSLLEHLKESPASILKLVRNKLTDEFVLKAMPYLSSTVMLNLSRNELTERSLQCILNVRRGGGLKLLKSVMIGQNKIVERKCREMFQELRKLGVNVCS